MNERRIREMFQSGRIDRRTFLRLMGGLAAGALASACGPAGSPAEAPQEAAATTAPTATTAAASPTPDFPRGELNIVQATTLDTLDVHATQGGLTPAITGHMMDGLKRRLHTGEWVPHLIESWENVDEVTWMFHLREGVTFHNGEQFNASVLEENFKRFSDGDIATTYGGERFTGFHKSVEVMDEYTVKWTTQEPLAPILEFIPDAFLMMSPKAIAELGNDVNNNAIGSGPFKFVEWIPGERLVMEANEEYWMGPPKLERINWRPILEPATRIVELKTGNADIISRVPAENIPELEDAGGIKIVRVPSELSAYIQLNVHEEPFNNPEVRRALNYAIDREAIVEHVMLGAGQPQVTFLTSAHEGYDPSLEPYPYDPDQARKMIEQAGYPNGFAFSLAGPSGRYYKDREILEAVAGQLEAIGLTVELDIKEWGAYIGEFIQKPPVFDAGMIGYGDGGSAFSSLNMSVYSPSQAAGWYGYENSTFNSLFEEAMATFDAEERDAKVQELRKMLYEDAPFIYIASQQIIYAVREEVQDFFPWPDGDYWLREGDGCYLA